MPALPRFGRRASAVVPAAEPSPVAENSETVQRRKQSRTTLRNAVRVVIDGQPIDKARLVDLSPIGCHISNVGDDLRPGQVIALKLAEVVKINGIIRWFSSGSTGIEFVQFLPERLIEELAWND